MDLLEDSSQGHIGKPNKLGILRQKMEELDMRGQIIKCIECTHCNVEEMRCFPKSEDCEKEYDLTEQDLYTKARCDFGEKK